MRAGEQTVTSSENIGQLLYPAAEREGGGKNNPHHPISQLILNNKTKTTFPFILLLCCICNGENG
jgi:hypothetical protein